MLRTSQASPRVALQIREAGAFSKFPLQRYSPIPIVIRLISLKLTFRERGLPHIEGHSSVTSFVLETLLLIM